LGLSTKDLPYILPVKISGWLEFFLLDHIPCASNFVSHLLVLGPYDLLERDQPVQVSKISREKKNEVLLCQASTKLQPYDGYTYSSLISLQTGSNKSRQFSILVLT
jgi:hypothetical protein